MKRFLTPLLMGLTLMIAHPLLATGRAPRASDYDRRPEEVFNSTGMVADQDSARVKQLSRILAGPVTGKLKSYTRASEPQIFSIEYDAGTQMDWEALVELNTLASTAWDSLLACNGGNALKARAQYVSGSFCKPADGKMKQFFDSVTSFLSTTSVKEFSGPKAIHCADPQNCPDVLTAESRMAVMEWHIVLGYSPVHDREMDLHDGAYSLNRMLGQLPEQSFHPLLIQAFLENLAAGYPLHYGTYTCGGARCALMLLAGGPSKIVLDSEDIEWSLRGYSKNHEGEAKRMHSLQWVQSLLNGETLPVIPTSLGDNQNLLLLRRALTAARFLNHMGIGRLHFSDWGLWPRASLNMIGILAESEYRMPGRDYINPDVNLLAMRLSDLSQIPIAHQMVAPGATNDRNGEGGPNALSVIGAWRELYNRH